jgi:hypothetical protein
VRLRDLALLVPGQQEWVFVWPDVVNDMLRAVSQLPCWILPHLRVPISAAIQS